MKNRFTTAAATFMLSIALAVSSPAHIAGTALAAQSQVKYENAVNKILKGVNPNWRAEEKLFYLHDYLVTHTRYDESLKKYDAYDALVGHDAVCSGYAEAFKDLANRIGIPTTVIVSINHMGHGWNAVKLNGKWYYVDCTYDDILGAPTGDYCKHDNFLCNETGIRSTHYGYDWKVGIKVQSMTAYELYRGEYVCGKYTDSTYEWMNWKNVNTKVTLLDKGIAYYNQNDNSVYTYRCNGTKPKKIMTLKNKPKDYYKVVSGSGNTVFICDNNRIYSYKFGSSDAPKAIYSLNSNERLSGNMTGVSVSGKSLRYDIGSEGGYYKHPDVNRAGYIDVSKTSKMTASKTGKVPKSATARKGTKFSSNKITYKITGSKTVSVVGIKGTSVSIPAVVSYRGGKYMVSSISAGAASLGKVKELTIGSCVQTIGDKAFYKCPLKKIYVKSGVIKKVGSKAFYIGGKPVMTVPSDCRSSYRKLCTKAGFPSKGKIK